MLYSEQNDNKNIWLRIGGLLENFIKEDLAEFPRNVRIEKVFYAHYITNQVNTEDACPRGPPLPCLRGQIANPLSLERLAKR